jgi:hypothetical protein
VEASGGPCKFIDLHGPFFVLRFSMTEAEVIELIKNNLKVEVSELIKNNLKVEVSVGSNVKVSLLWNGDEYWNRTFASDYDSLPSKSDNAPDSW